MADTPNNVSTPVTIKKIATNLQRIGRFGLLVQLAPAAISGLLLLTSIAWTASHGSTRNTGGGLVFATLSLILLLAALFWFFRYTKTASRFRDANNRPSKADTIKLIRSGVMINVIGLGFAVLGAEVLIINLFWKSLSLLNPFALSTAVYSSNSSISNIVIQPIDVLVSLANTQTIFAHFVGLVCSLWLLSDLAKQSNKE
jgi:Protein of unknown function (DUF3611)